MEQLYDAYCTKCGTPSQRIRLDNQGRCYSCLRDPLKPRFPWFTAIFGVFFTVIGGLATSDPSTGTLPNDGASRGDARVIMLIGIGILVTRFGGYAHQSSKYTSLGRYFDGNEWRSPAPRYATFPPPNAPRGQYPRHVPTRHRSPARSGRALRITGFIAAAIGGIGLMIPVDESPFAKNRWTHNDVVASRILLIGGIVLIALSIARAIKHSQTGPQRS